jgi:hypothetical protein
MSHVLGPSASGAFLDDVLDQITLVEAVVVARIQTGTVEEDFLSVVAANETEASIPNHLLDLATAFWSTRGRGRATAGNGRPLSPATATAASGCAEAVGVHEFVSEEVERHRQILETVLLGREQNLAFLSLDHAVTEARILVRHEESGFNLVESQHGTFPRFSAGASDMRSLRHPAGKIGAAHPG